MIGTIRKHQQWLWGIIIVAIIVSFVIYFLPNGQSIFSGTGGAQNFGSINNRPITREELRDARAEMELFYFLRTGRWPGNNEETQTGFNLDHETYTRLLLVEKLKELKIEPPLDVTAKWISEIFRGTNEQTFPMERYQTFIKNELAPHQLTSDDFYRFARHQVGQQHLISVYGMGGKLITSQEAESFYRRLNEPFATEAVFFSASNFLSSITVTPAALGDFFTNNMAEYRLPDRVQVNYVKWELTNFLAEADVELGKVTNLAQRIDSIYLNRGTNVFRDENGKPLSPEDSKKKIKEDSRKQLALAAAQKKANEVLTGLFEGRDEKNPLRPGDFEKYAREKNLDFKTTPPFDRETGAEQLHLPPLFVQAAFTLRADEPEESVKGIPTTEGVYVIALNRRFLSEMQPLEKVRERVTEDYRAAQALKLARQAAAIFDQTLTNGLAAGKTFSDLAAAANVKPVALPAFTLHTRALPELEGRAPLEAVQNVATSLSPGQVSGVVPTENGAFILYLKSKLPVDEARLKMELPEFLERQREQRMSAAFSDWFQKMAQEMKLVVPEKNAGGKS